jgi:DNA-binding transcriptional LysR family regulator
MVTLCHRNGLDEKDHVSCLSITDKYAGGRMELRHLRYFVAVAEAENVSRAALKLHVSQPALSRQIRDLEDDLGFPLLERSAKSVRLTEAGRTFLTEARAVLQRAEEAVKAAKAVATGADGEVHVGYAPSITARILPATLRAFQAELPNVHVKLHDLSTEEMFAGLREGKLQLAFAPQPASRTLRGLNFEELIQDPICLALSPKHRLARHRTVSVADFVREPIIAYSRKDYPEAHELLDRIFAPAKARPHIVEEHDSVSGLIAAVESGAGSAIVSETLTCTAGVRLKLIPILPPPAPLVIGIVYERKELNAAGEHFLKCAKESAKELRVLSTNRHRPVTASSAP